MKTLSQAQSKTLSQQFSFTGNSSTNVIIGNQKLTINDVARVARNGTLVSLTNNTDVLQGIQASCDYINNAVESGEPIYGVTSGFGGMANVAISREQASELQTNLVWFLKTGAGNKLPLADVRAAMLLRANSHMHGASGIRLELIKRMETFLNAGVTPYVYEFGSIGASGDLVPLSYITGSLIGLDPSFKVDFNGKEMDAPTALSQSEFVTPDIVAEGRLGDDERHFSNDRHCSKLRLRYSNFNCDRYGRSRSRYPSFKRNQSIIPPIYP